MNETITCCGAKTYCCNTAIVGSGAAGFNAADRLWQAGQHDILLVTEGVRLGTSRNTGSDKQTYYKLTLAGSEPDSVYAMAQTLYGGQCVDGDNALCEAALSTECFLHLNELGVPFPKNRWGEYVGYKTDHDPCRRATSIGPYTSRCMTECLEASVRQKGVPILDHLLVVRILTQAGAVRGLLCLDTARAADAGERFVLVCCTNVIYATGGPAGMYADSVYPLGHYGASGLAFEAGVSGQNLTEWQFGLASVAPRWNVSGTYMQAMPRIFSTDADGGDEREFLNEAFPDRNELLSLTFLKGYQWPFDVRKLRDGSSILDLLVYREQQKGRKIFLDYTREPGGAPVDFAALCPEARDYLQKADACLATPIERLRRMNGPAVEFYRDKGVDLAAQPLQIALCAQHNNGGLAVNAWWETDLKGFFAVGEAAGTHGVYRPGGTALNAGQVGSLRAAQYIAARRQASAAPDADFAQAAAAVLAWAGALADAVLANTAGVPVQQCWRQAAARMSLAGGAIRDADAIRAAEAETRAALETLQTTVYAAGPGSLRMAFRLRDMLLSQAVYLGAMRDYMAQGGKSRGSALYVDPDGEKPRAFLPDTLRFVPDDGAFADRIQQVQWRGGRCVCTWRAPRAIPQEDNFFETTWRTWRESRNIF